MKVALKKLVGPWDEGWALDKHTLKSTYLGDDQYGHPRFENVRTEVGEATFQLKYRNDWTQVAGLANALAVHVVPRLPGIGFIVPMPPSRNRSRQPVVEIAQSLGQVVRIPVFTDTLRKTLTGTALKDLPTKEEKVQALANAFSINDEIAQQGRWNVLIVDDLVHTGASMEAACAVLRNYPKTAKIYVAALTWR